MTCGYGRIDCRWWYCKTHDRCFHDHLVEQGTLARSKVTDVPKLPIISFRRVPATPAKVKKTREVREQPTPITIDNFWICTTGTFKPIDTVPDGYIQVFSSKGSKYFTDGEGKYLVRLSDHWGGEVRYCAWFLEGHKKTVSWRWKKLYGETPKIGIIAFEELEPNYRQGKFPV